MYGVHKLHVYRVQSQFIFIQFSSPHSIDSLTPRFIRLCHHPFFPASTYTTSPGVLRRAPTTSAHALTVRSTPYLYSVPILRTNTPYHALNQSEIERTSFSWLKMSSSNNNNNDNNLKINTSSLPTRLPPSTSDPKEMGPVPPTLEAAVFNALVSSGSVNRIESSLTDDLAACGWVANVRAYVTQLVRSGECTTFNEVMDKVRTAMLRHTPVDDGTSGAKGSKNVMINGDQSNPVRLVQEGEGSPRA